MTKAIKLKYDDFDERREQACSEFLQRRHTDHVMGFRILLTSDSVRAGDEAVSRCGQGSKAARPHLPVVITKEHQDKTDEIE